MTASPIYLGTGMRVELKLKLNKLKINDVQNILNNTEFVAEEKNNEILIVNKITIGKSETELLCNLLDYTKKIIDKDE
jgi:protein-arginine kinase